jgi:hypothetical protein
MESNLTESNIRRIPMFLTPEQFLSLYKILYESDESIGRIKQTAFVINSILIVFGIFF